MDGLESASLNLLDILANFLSVYNFKLSRTNQTQNINFGSVVIDEHALNSHPRSLSQLGIYDVNLVL